MSESKYAFWFPVKDPGPSLIGLVHVQPLSAPIGELLHVEGKMPDLNPDDNICTTFRSK